MAKTVKGRRRKEYKHYNSGARRKLQKKERKKTSAYITMEDQGHFSKDFDRRRACKYNILFKGEFHFVDLGRTLIDQVPVYHLSRYKNVKFV